MLTTQTMADRYQTARQLFLTRARDAGWQVESLEHPLRGPCDIPVFTDIATGGNQSSDDLYLITSATHGIEGYLGSELQSRLLADGTLDATKDKALAMIHGINPYGFAWHRRVNEDNVDLNRNFIDFRLPLPVNDGYAEFYDYVNPKEWTDAHIQAMEAKSKEALERMGWNALFKAVSGGQYDHPEGIQYGGRGPVWSRRMIEQVWPDLMQGKRRVAHLDLHTGLGPKGYGMLMAYGAEGQATTIRAKAAWPDILMSPPPGDPAIMTAGTLGAALPHYTPNAEVLSVTLEYGTLEGHLVTRSMAADNWLHHHGEMDSLMAQAIKQQILDAFYVDEPDYREEAWQRCQQVVRDLIKAS